MMEAARGASLKVVFFDGEQETSLGKVSISSTFNFKQFQAAVGEKLGLSSHQFSIYLSNRKNRSNRVPVTGKMDLAAVSRDKDCMFLVILKQSRRERRRRPRGTAEMINHRSDPPANVMLLRRDGNGIAIDGGGGFSGAEGFDRSRSGFERRIKELQAEKERFLKMMGFGIERTDRTVVCDECLRAKEMGRDSGFHWCVHDTVTVGFRSPAGPIARPAKGSG